MIAGFPPSCRVRRVHSNRPECPGRASVANGAHPRHGRRRRRGGSCHDRPLDRDRAGDASGRFSRHGRAWRSISWSATIRMSSFLTSACRIWTESRRCRSCWRRNQVSSCLWSRRLRGATPKSACTHSHWGPPITFPSRESDRESAECESFRRELDRKNRALPRPQSSAAGPAARRLCNGSERSRVRLMSAPGIAAHRTRSRAASLSTGASSRAPDRRLYRRATGAQGHSRRDREAC